MRKGLLKLLERDGKLQITIKQAYSKKEKIRIHSATKIKKISAKNRTGFSNDLPVVFSHTKLI